MAKQGKTSQDGLWLVKLFWLIGILCGFSGGLIYLWDKSSELVPQNLLLLGYYALGLALLFLVLASVLTVQKLLTVFQKLHNDSEMMVATMRRLLGSESQKQALLTQISENILLSDAIKSVAFREKDSTVLREAIQEDIRTEQWESASVLIDALEERFGYKMEADQHRNDLLRYRRTSTEEKIDSAVHHVESMWMIHRYEEALRESEKLAKLYPQSEKVLQLTEKTEVRRQAHKKELLARWDEAVKKNDFEQGVDLLKLLDAYLTPSEAAALEETAREVFRGKLQNYSVQFTMFVTEKQWAKALDVGLKIMDEFPNTRIAQEVREKIDILKHRARQPQVS
jgi:hypothetical protein